MRLRLELEAGAALVATLIAENDEEEPLVFDRRTLLGPNLSGPEGPFPPSADPEFAEEELNDVALHPGTFYGRTRRWTELPPGDYEVTATLLDDDGEPELTAGPHRVSIG